MSETRLCGDTRLRAVLTLAAVTIATFPVKSGTSSMLNFDLGTNMPMAVRSKRPILVVLVLL